MSTCHFVHMFLINGVLILKTSALLVGTAENNEPCDTDENESTTEFCNEGPIIDFPDIEMILILLFGLVTFVVLAICCCCFCTCFYYFKGPCRSGRSRNDNNSTTANSTARQSVSGDLESQVHPIDDLPPPYSPRTSMDLGNMSFKSSLDEDTPPAYIDLTFESEPNFAATATITTESEIENTNVNTMPIESLEEKRSGAL